ncbi:MAG: 50S ribosomal protein L17 [Candidatus Omnitrophota bacterium]
MRHNKAKNQLNRFTSWRKATILSLVRSLFIYQRISTTLARAKAARSQIDKLITMGKKNTLAKKRQAFKLLGDHKLVSILFNDIAPRFNQRQGGYTRLLLLGKRRGDDAQMAILELTEVKEKAKKVKKNKVKEAKPKTSISGEITEKTESMPEKLVDEKSKAETAVKERPPVTKKPAKKFFSGIKNIFKKKSDSL